VFQPNEKAGGYMVNGDETAITYLVRQAVELGADIIKADPTDDVSRYHKIIEAASGIPVLVRGGGRTLGEAAYFGCNDGETPTGLARARRFHGGVERQDVGLEGDAVDHANDVADEKRRHVVARYAGSFSCILLVDCEFGVNKNRWLERL
jgi:hypothetical protein